MKSICKFLFKAIVALGLLAMVYAYGFSDGQRYERQFKEPVKIFKIA